MSERHRTEPMVVSIKNHALFSTFPKGPNTAVAMSSLAQVNEHRPCALHGLPIPAPSLISPFEATEANCGR